MPSTRVRRRAGEEVQILLIDLSAFSHSPLRHDHSRFSGRRLAVPRTRRMRSVSPDSPIPSGFSRQFFNDQIMAGVC
jgi:hypothetical protein